MTEPAKKPAAKRTPRTQTQRIADDKVQVASTTETDYGKQQRELRGAPGPADENDQRRPTMEEWERAMAKPGALWNIPTPYPSVHELWSRVMDSVRSVEKGDYNKEQHFRFRGIDAVMEAVGPALRAHKVHVRPRRILEHSATEYTSKNGARMVNRVVRVEWEVTGPQGDSFVGESMGEAADAGDKSLTKAQSVAYRVFLLNALTVPTGDPDPDAESHERATPSAVQQAVAQASEKTYRTREEYEREQYAKAQQQALQAQAGEENQAAVPDNEEARADMWREAKKLGWKWEALKQRFQSDYGMETTQADPQTLKAFTKLLQDEAAAEEEQAKANAAEVLGAKEVQPDEAQPGGVL